MSTGDDREMQSNHMIQLSSFDTVFGVPVRSGHRGDSLCDGKIARHAGFPTSTSSAYPAVNPFGFV